MLCHAYLPALFLAVLVTARPEPTTSALAEPKPTTSTSSTLPTCTPSTFKLTVTLVSDYLVPDTPLTGDYVMAVPGEDGSDITKLTTDASLGSIFTLNADCSLQYGAKFAALPVGTSYRPFAFFIPAAGSYNNAVCTTDGVELSCEVQAGSYYHSPNKVVFTCGNGPEFSLIIGPAGRPYNECYDLHLLLAPV